MKKRVFSLALALVLTLALVPAFSAPAQAAGTWQEAYADLLRSGSHTKSDGYDNKFGLTDMDGNGIPELVLYNSMWNHCFVFTYSFGVVTEAGSYWGDVHNMALPYVDGILEDGDDTFFWTLRDGKMVEVPFTNSSPLNVYAITESNIKKYILDTATVTPGATTPANTHYFAKALQEFNEVATIQTGAILADLDGDGIKEMIAFKMQKYQGSMWYDRTITVGIFNEKYPGSPMLYNNEDMSRGSYDDTHGLPQIYLSEKGYIIVDIPGGDNEIYFICEYSSSNSNLIKMYEDTAPSYTVGGKSISKSQYENYLSLYGIGKSKVKLFGYGEGVDQSAEILAMTAAPSSKTATPTASTVYFNGKAIVFEGYNIDGNNYYKLRDLAKVLSGSVKQFEVGYNNDTKAITLTSGKAYTSVGGEMAAGDGKAKTATPTVSKIYLDGKELTLTVYTINGSNFFKLRDLMKAIDVYVGYDTATKNITLDTSNGYVEP